LVRSALAAVEEVASCAPDDLQKTLAGHLAELRDKASKPFEYSGLTRNDVLTEIEGVLYSARADRPTARAGSQAFKAGCERIRDLRKDIVERAHNDYSTNVYAEGKHSPCGGERIEAAYLPDPKKDTQAHVISAGIATLMSRDPRVVVYGEDTARLGGVQTCTVGLQGGHASVPETIWQSAFALHRYLPKHGFGQARIWDHAVAENTIVGGGVGLSLRGLRPIAEIQYHDYVVWALQQMVDEVASLRHRTDGGQACPMLIRTHGHQLMGMWHSGSPIGMVLSSCAGLRVLTPRNGVQAIGMYRAVLQGGDPAFSVEPLMTMYEREDVPENLDMIRFPLGESQVLRPGKDISIVTYGYCCQVAKKAAEQLAAKGIDAEVVDLQTLNPLDLNRVAEDSIKKTQMALFLDEDIPEGATAVIAKTLLWERGCWDHINGMTFVTAPHHKPPYGLDGKMFTKPQPRDVVAAAFRMFDEIDGRNRSL
jgi:pyruvate/2-oxoglutarate/acetoin dehydrogenase E1 component